MGEFIHHKECRVLSEAIALLAAGIKDEPVRWISTPNGDEGNEWCFDCGYYKVRNLRRHDRKRAEDYRLDGGWGSEEEHMCFCAGCGKRLRVTLLEYGVRGELEHYRDNGFLQDVAQTAYDLVAILNACEVTSEKNADMAHEAIELARRFAKQNHLLLAEAE